MPAGLRDIVEAEDDGHVRFGEPVKELQGKCDHHTGADHILHDVESDPQLIKVEDLVLFLGVKPVLEALGKVDRSE